MNIPIALSMHDDPLETNTGQQGPRGRKSQIIKKKTWDFGLRRLLQRRSCEPANGTSLSNRQRWIIVIGPFGRQAAAQHAAGGSSTRRCFSDGCPRAVYDQVGVTSTRVQYNHEERREEAGVYYTRHCRFVTEPRDGPYIHIAR